LHTDPEIVGLASRRVPRYTSYPTAVQFSADVVAETYRAWLGALAPDTKLSAYLHVPFCQHLCFYCGCHTRAERNRGVIGDYAETLRREIELVGSALPGRSLLSRIHWGGGTPTELGGEGLAHVLGAVAAAFDFDERLEHAIEIDPRRVDRASIRALAELGINRASLGVQTFDLLVQSAIGRVQPFEQVDSAVTWLREAGIEAISFDLMYGLPYQTVSSVLDTVQRAVRLRPARVSVFGYAHVPWMKKVQGGIAVDTLPGPEERLAQMLAMRDALVAGGYREIGFDHFALPDDTLALCAGEGRLQRNFQGYTDDTAEVLLGFGASAIGRLPAGYVQNVADARSYASAVAEGRLATGRGRALTAEDRERAGLIRDVLCEGRVRLDEAVSPPIRLSARERVAPFIGHGLVAMEDGCLQVTDAGWPFARLIASVFDGYLPDNPAGHSLAV
jgi:oxygen-independent coproporphyrinogen-3 oxidase